MVQELHPRVVGTVRGQQNIAVRHKADRDNKEGQGHERRTSHDTVPHGTIEAVPRLPYALQHEDNQGSHQGEETAWRTPKVLQRGDDNRPQAVRDVA